MNACFDVGQGTRVRALEFCDELIAYNNMAIQKLAQERNVEPLLQKKRELDNTVSAYAGVVERLAVIRSVLQESVTRHGRPATWTTP